MNVVKLLDTKVEILHVYTNDKISEKEIRETMSFTIVSKE